MPPALLLALLAAAPPPAAATAEPPTQEVAAPARLSWGGSVRTRLEVKDDFRFGAPGPGSDEDYLLTQLRLNLSWRPAERAALFVELQDARILGESQAIDENAAPSTFADDLDVHQAYLDLGFEGARLPARLRLGRQKLNLGALRLVASLEWVNTARVWDGARLTLGREEGRSLDVFSTRLVAVDPSRANDWGKTGSRLFGSDFHGLYFTDRSSLPGGRWEAYYLLRHEGDFGDRVHTLGARLERAGGGWDFNLELAGQTGRYGRRDHRAAAAHFELGRKVAWPRDGRLSVAYNYGSGDGDAGDDEHGTFDNLYPLNHAYYGQMDLAALQNLHNFEAVLRAPAGGRATVRLAYQAFWLAEPASDAWYNAGAGVIRRAAPGVDPDSFVGSEVDVTVTVPLTLAGQRLEAEAGWGHFFTGGYVRDTGPDADADFFYLQTKIGF